MTVHPSWFWKKVPFLKLLLALVAGIVFQWYVGINDQYAWLLFAAGLLAVGCFSFIAFFHRYRFAFVNGVFISVTFIALGMLLTWHKDIRHDTKWFGRSYSQEDVLVVTLQEPPVEKTRSLKAAASVNYLFRDNRFWPVKGTIILYFHKDSSLQLRYGSQLFFKKSLQEIKDAGNPGGFNYKRYALFQGITHQVYLKAGEFAVARYRNETVFKKFLFSSKEKLLDILRENIKTRKELGLAEALLIGYKQDLDQSLVQSYTNTGVVHIIAISGLHLGLIYWLMALLLRPLQKTRKTKWIRAILIIGGLWIFSLLAGAQPSILRSALMFTCIVLGESLTKRSSIYNTMAVSAFVLLCINPFWLWDVGFQLSYSAVLSIIIFMQPLYHLFYIKNKILDTLWKMNAVTLAAQILTVPLSIYHFHQFPNLFILTNFLAVPLSGIILLGEIWLCVISLIPDIARFSGRIISWLIQVMNTYIENIESIPYSLWNGLQVSFAQVILLYFFIAGIAFGVLHRSLRTIQLGLASLLLVALLRCLSFRSASRQQDLIVYNVPQKRAIDLFSGRAHVFIGDSSLLTDDFARNFHLKPNRVLHRVNETLQLEGLYRDEHHISFHGYHILLLDKNISLSPAGQKQVIDLLIISGKPPVTIKKITDGLEIKQVVADGSVPAWKAKYWKKDCDSLHIPFHDVSSKGAFVMSLR